MASLHGGNGRNCPWLFGPLQLDGWLFWKGWQAQQVAHCWVDAASQWAPGDVAWGTPLLGSNHLAGGCVLTSRHLLVAVLGFCCLDERGPPRHWCDGIHSLRGSSAVFLGTAAERPLAMVYRPGTWGIFVPVHTSLQLDLVWVFSGDVWGPSLCCSLRSSLWHFCFNNEAILQPGRSMVPLLALGAFRTLWIGQHFCAVEGFFLLWYKIQTSRAAMLTRVIVIGTLALAPVLLATDVETWQGGVEAPSISPTTYFNISMENWTHPYIEVKRHQVHWLQMPQPIWPSKNDLPDTSTRRATFWLSYMSCKFGLAAVMAFLVLKCSCASSKQSRDGAEKVEPLTELEEAQGEKFDDSHRSVIFCAIFPIYITLVIKVSCTAALFGQLTAKTGLAFEGYDLCLTCGLLWLVVQALALRASDFEAQYDSADVLLSMSFLLPFIGDGFDSLKDAMLGALALRSHLQPLRCLGLASLVYLVTFHAVLAPTRKSLPTSAFLEEAKAGRSRRRHSRRRRLVPKTQGILPQSAGTSLRASKTFPPVGDASGGLAPRHACIGGVIGGGLSSLHSRGEHGSADFSDHYGMAPAWEDRFTACRLVSWRGPESFRCRAICTLRGFHRSIASAAGHIICQDVWPVGTFDGKERKVLFGSMSKGSRWPKPH